MRLSRPVARSVAAAVFLLFLCCNSPWLTSTTVVVAVASSSSSSSLSTATPFLFPRGGSSSSTSNHNAMMILRLRMPDGSVERLAIPEDQQSVLSLRQVLAKTVTGAQDDEDDDDDDDRLTCWTGGGGGTTAVVQVKDETRTLKELGIGHGTLITLKKKQAAKEERKDSHGKTASSIVQRKRQQRQDDRRRWHPYPDLARDYRGAVRQNAARRGSRGGMSYEHLSHQQEAMHVVEPQTTGRVTRLYMCQRAAQSFQSGCFTKKKGEIHNRVGLLLGTFGRERVDRNKPKPRTSLSTTTQKERYCTVAKVHAIYEPPKQQRVNNSHDDDEDDDSYDAEGLQSVLRAGEEDGAAAAVLRVAGWLGLEPVGWIFTHKKDRQAAGDDNDTDGGGGLPVLAGDVQVAAELQIQCMKKADHHHADGAADDKENPHRGCFVTAAMHAGSGATETFQLSDVAVQMVSEGQLRILPGQNAQRYCQTVDPILVDGRETRDLDTVLCLVNTAILSHKGSFSGDGEGTAAAVVKKNGRQLTKKTSKAILEALERQGGTAADDAALLESLRDFRILLAFDSVLSRTESKALCQTVQKFTKGQKKGTTLSDKLKRRLRHVVESSS